MSSMSGKPSLSESFNGKYSSGRAGYESPDERPDCLSDVRSLSPRWQRLWMLEELFDVELEIWGKSRAKLNNSDVQDLLDAAVEELDAVPVIVSDVLENPEESGEASR